MKRLRFLGLAPLLMISLSGIALAQYSSSNYKANEVFFGNGGDNNQSSANYKAGVSSGALGVGQYSSANYQAYSGFLTPNEPFLELGIDSSSADLGVVDASATKYAQANFHVRAYIDTGYTVQTVSNPPSYTSGSVTNTLPAKSPLAAPSVGIEEFGINLVKNANFCGAGCDLGADPSPQPNGTFATGVAASGYDMPGEFKYGVGDIIAKTPSGSNGWGLTDFTISYIADASILTPAGDYQMVQDLVVVATY